MSYILADIPYFPCMVRREYTRNMQDGHGEFLGAICHAVRCELGRTLQFRVAFMAELWRPKPEGGYQFEAAPTGGAFYSLLPPSAIVHDFCDPLPLSELCPWDCFSSDFAVLKLEFMVGMRMVVLPKRVGGRYMFTIDYKGSSLADDPEQHKEHHVLMLDSGHIGAYPNNRILFVDPAYCPTTTENPGFVSLAPAWSAE